MTLANLKRQSGGNWTKLDVFMPYTQVHQTPPDSCPFRVEDSCAIPINTRVEKFSTNVVCFNDLITYSCHNARSFKFTSIR